MRSPIYDGQPLAGNPDNPLFLWWAQAETARAFFHLSALRHEPYEDDFRRVASLLHGPLTDTAHGGLFDAVDVTNRLSPVGLNKGNVWKVNYHYTMLFAEVLRLG